MKKLLLSILLILSVICSVAQQQFDYQAHSTNVSDAYTVNITNVTAYSTGTPERGIGFSIIFDTSSSGACTLNVTGSSGTPLGAVTINGDITAGVVYRLEYNVVTDQFDMISGSGGVGSSTSHNNLPIEYRTDDFDLVPGDTSKLLVLDDGVGITLDLASAVDGSQFVWWNPSPSLPPGITAGGTVVLDTGLYTYAHYNNDTLRIANGGSGGGSGGAVSSVFGRTGAVVAVAGDYEASEVDFTPAGNISATDVQAMGQELDTEKQATITFGTGVQTALGNNIGSAGAPVLFNGAGGTPSSLTLTNGTGLPISGITGLGSGVGTWLATPSSANLASALTDETGTGAAVFANSPVFTTPNIGTATGTASGDWHNTGTTTLAGANTIAASATNTLDFSYSGTIGVSTNRLFTLDNSNAAALGAQQISPPFVQRGRGWATGSSSSMTVDFYQYTLPIQGAAAPTGTWNLASSINGSAPGPIMTVSNTGRVTADNFFATGGSSSFILNSTNRVLEVVSNTIRLRGTLDGTAGATGVKIYSTVGSATSGNQVMLQFGSPADGVGYAPGSGTGTYTHAQFDPVINQTGGANGAVTVLNVAPTYTAAGGNVTGIDYNPTVTSISGTHTGLRIRAGNASIDNGNLTLATAGNGLLVKTGTNATAGTATLVGGTVTVNTTKTTASSIILLTSQSDGGTPGFVRVSGRSAGTSFTITSSSGTDTSVIGWFIVEPAP